MVVVVEGGNMHYKKGGIVRGIFPGEYFRGNMSRGNVRLPQGTGGGVQVVQDTPG